MSLIHHRHSGGNFPHVHRHDAADEPHHRGREHHNEDHRSDGHGDQAYDVDGNEAAIVASDPHRLEHWHFDCLFERLAIAPIRDAGNDYPVTVFAVVNRGLNRLPLAARAPPLFI